MMESVTNVYDAVSAAMRMGFPVVIKAEGPLHKTEAELGEVGLDHLEARGELDEGRHELQS